MAGTPAPSCHLVLAQQSTYRGENGLDGYDEDSDEEAVGGVVRDGTIEITFSLPTCRHVASCVYQDHLDTNE